MKSDVTSKNKISKKREEMSRLDELIKELCPNGVEYKKTKDIVQEKFWIMPETPNFIEEGIPYITSKNIKNGFIDFKDVKYVSVDDYNRISNNRKIKKDDMLITMIGTIGEVAIVEDEIDFYGQNLYLLRMNNEIILNKYYYYYITLNKIKRTLVEKRNTSSQGYIKAGNIENLLIPVPPLEVQEEIVRILDDYTKSVEELKEKLNAELITRKKQYSWYRDYLLKFENKIKIVKLGELFEFKNGINKEKSSFGKGTPIINYVNVYKKNKIYFEDLQGLVEATDDELIRYKVKRGDVFFTRTSETIEEIGFTSVLLEDIENCVFSGFLLRARPLTDLLLPEYCAYCFSTSSMRNAIIRKSTYTTRALINGTSLSQIEIPLPPLEVQKRIVEVLDNFEKTCKELNIELSSEIEIKEKEYEFVRNYLLTFEEKSRQAILACELASLRSKQQAQNLIKILQYVYGYVEVRLGDIASIVRGNGLQKRDFTEEGVGCIHYGQIYTKYGMVAEKTISFVEESLAEKLRKVEKGDIIFAVTSENIEDLCKCVVWLGEDEIVTGGHTAILKHNQNSKFLAYYFQTEAFHSQKRKLATGTKVMDITATKLEEILISLPPLEEQQRIVDILDRFDRLCNDISEGLPAEIEARQKQYEYYREKLLNFKKL